MTSVLNVDSIAAKDGTSPVELTKQSAAKAWVNVDRSSASSRDSFNISGLTDNGTGDFTQAFTNSFVNDDYTTGAVATEQGSGAAGTYMNSSSYWATGSHRWQSWYYSSTKYDDLYAQNTYTGDLA